MNSSFGIGNHSNVNKEHICIVCVVWIHYTVHLYFLCCLQSIAAHRDHFVWRPVAVSVRSHTFLVVMLLVCFAVDTFIPQNAATYATCMAAEIKCYYPLETALEGI